MSDPDCEDASDVIYSGVAIAVSDGSFKDEFGISAWTIRGTTDEQHLIGVNTVPGSTEDQSAYRSELAGLYGLSQQLHALVNT